MDKKEYKKLISTYIQVILGFIGISSTLLIPLLITYYFEYFDITPEEQTLSSEQLSNINWNLTFLIGSIYIFIFSLFLSLILFSKFSFSDIDMRKNPKRINFLVKSIKYFIFGGIITLIISIEFFLMIFIPNKLFILNSLFLAFLVGLMVYLVYMVRIIKSS